MQNPAVAVNALTNENLSPVKRGIAITLFTASAVLYVIELVQSSIKDYVLLESEDLFFLSLLLTGGCLGWTANPALKGRHDLGKSFGGAFAGAFFVVFSNALAISIAEENVLGIVFSGLLTFACLFSFIGTLDTSSGVAIRHLFTPSPSRQPSNREEEISPLLHNPNPNININ